MNRPVHFEIHADDPQRAIAFYEKAFGWTFNKWPGEWDYWMISTGDETEAGINGGLIKRQGPPPAAGAPVNAFPCTIGVDSVDDAINHVTAAGGIIVVDKMPIPGVGYLAYAHDTEGNIVGMMQEDPTAQ